MAREKTPLNHRQKRRIKDVASKTASLRETHKLIATELGMASQNTFYKKVREDPNFEQELLDMYEANALRQGGKAAQRLEKFVDTEYKNHDTDGQKLALEASGKLLARSDKIIERKSKLKTLEQQLKDKSDTIKELQDRLNKISSGSGGGVAQYVIPYYIMDYGDDYYAALQNQQQALLDYVALEAEAKV